MQTNYKPRRASKARGTPAFLGASFKVDDVEYSSDRLWVEMQQKLQGKTSLIDLRYHFAANHATSIADRAMDAKGKKDLAAQTQAQASMQEQLLHRKELRGLPPTALNLDTPKPCSDSDNDDPTTIAPDDDGDDGDDRDDSHAASLSGMSLLQLI